MKRNHPSNSSFWSRLIVVPAMIGLISASMLVGYASNEFAPSRSGHSRSWGTDLQLSRFFGQEAGRGDSETARDVNGSDDPVADYKAALSLLKENYYGAPVDAKKTRQLTYEAIRGMLFSLHDKFTSFLDPDEWSQFHATTRGDFEGIGAFLLSEGLFTKISRPIETGPAEKAGLKADDLIIKVDGKSIRGLDINEVVRRIKGRRGTKVALTILRNKKPFTFVLMRALVEPPIVQHWMEDSQAKIGHIVLKEFNEKSIMQIEHAYSDLQRQGMRGLIFDLRNNPGGLLEVAIQVASEFIPRDANKELKNAVVYIREGSGREQARTLDSEYSHKPLPLVVLVNDGSASASEIVTGAIKDYGIGTIIGERTFGKGKVQTLFPMDDGSALRLTTALYFPPKHKDINFQHDEDGERIPGTGGIVPDIEVAPGKWKEEDFRDKANDQQLKKALVFLRAKLNGMTTAQATEQLQRSH